MALIVCGDREHDEWQQDGTRRRWWRRFLFDVGLMHKLGNPIWRAVVAGWFMSRGCKTFTSPTKGWHFRP